MVLHIFFHNLVPIQSELLHLYAEIATKTQKKSQFSNIYNFKHTCNLTKIYQICQLYIWTTKLAFYEQRLDKNYSYKLLIQFITYSHLIWYMQILHITTYNKSFLTTLKNQIISLIYHTHLLFLDFICMKAFNIYWIKKIT